MVGLGLFKGDCLYKTDSMEEKGCVLPPAGPKQKAGVVQSQVTSHINPSFPGEERMKGSRSITHAGVPASISPSSQEQSSTTVGTKAPLGSNMNLRLSLLLACVRVCSCDIWFVTHQFSLSLTGDRFYLF